MPMATPSKTMDPKQTQETLAEQETLKEMAELAAAAAAAAALVKADKLFEEGSSAMEDRDYSRAVDCLKRAIDIRLECYGEFAKPCANSYFKYGYALFYKSIGQLDSLGTVPANPTGEGSSSENQNKKKGQEEEEIAQNIRLSLAYLNDARSALLTFKKDTVENVDLFSSLGEFFLKREDFEVSFKDYRSALSMAERLLEYDNDRIIDLNFRICLVLERDSKILEAIQYCTKAIFLCKSKICKLKEKGLANEVNLFVEILSELEETLACLAPSKDHSLLYSNPLRFRARGSPLYHGLNGPLGRPAFCIGDTVIGFMDFANLILSINLYYQTV